MNKVIQYGRLAKDPEVKTLNSGAVVMNCTIVTNRSVPKGDGYEDRPTFVDFTIWGKRGEAFARYHSNGDRAMLEGRLEADEWTDKVTGQKRSKLKMVVDEWEFAQDKAPADRDQGQNQEYDTPF